MLLGIASKYKQTKNEGLRDKSSLTMRTDLIPGQHDTLNTSVYIPVFSFSPKIYLIETLKASPQASQGYFCILFQLVNNCSIWPRKFSLVHQELLVAS